MPTHSARTGVIVCLGMRDRHRNALTSTNALIVHAMTRRSARTTQAGIAANVKAGTQEMATCAAKPRRAKTGRSVT